ncbi:MAG: IS110 family transposase [Cyclobacteriaceae bacterium]|nr:IS110 family transposase [Cyclobacteriaceae bacterium]
MDKVDEQILTFIGEDETLKQKYDLMLSIKGVGKVLAAMLLVYTHGFNRLADSRKPCCYSGVAPFTYESVHPYEVRQVYLNLQMENLNESCTWLL